VGILGLDEVGLACLRIAAVYAEALRAELGNRLLLIMMRPANAWLGFSATADRHRARTRAPKRRDDDERTFIVLDPSRPIG